MQPGAAVKEYSALDLRTSPYSKGQPFMKGKRKALNIVAIVIALFVPWVLFCAVYGMLTFSIHYTQPLIAYLSVAVLFVFGVLFPMFLAAQGQKHKFQDPETYQPSWYIFLAVTCLVAFVCGIVAGHSNFDSYMKPYYDLTHMASYKDVNTNDDLGQQLMDAGQVQFAKGTALDLSRSMGFKNHDIYCVAPIVTKGNPHQPLSLDFWAVGKNCCSGSQGSGFACGQWGAEKGGLRVVRDEERAFYRLAVQQAESAYQIKAIHPLFFHINDAAADHFEHGLREGYRNFTIGMFAYFGFQLILVVAYTFLWQGTTCSTMATLG